MGGAGFTGSVSHFVQTQFSVDALLISNQERGIPILAPPLSSGVSGKSLRLHSPSFLIRKLGIQTFISRVTGELHEKTRKLPAQS